jgi:hypothetical protein
MEKTLYILLFLNPLPKSLNFNNFLIETPQISEKIIHATFNLLYFFYSSSSVAKITALNQIPDISIDELLQTPTTINVAGKSLFLKTFLGIDLMPGPERRPLLWHCLYNHNRQLANTIFNFRRRRLDSLQRERTSFEISFKRCK